MPDEIVEKRKKTILTRDEGRILKWLYLKTLIPVAAAIIISSTILFFGFQTLLNKASFGNYGISPSWAVSSVTQFISTYMAIAAANIVLIIALSAVVMYLVLHDLVLPVMRITRELKTAMETRRKTVITVRGTDMLLRPLVDLLNKMISQYI